MTKCPKTETLENILANVNSQMDKNLQGTQLFAISGSINSLTLKINDINKETEYQERKNMRATSFFRRMISAMTVASLLFAIFGFVLTYFGVINQFAIYVNLIVALLSIVVSLTLPKNPQYLQNLILCYSLAIMVVYVIYTSQVNTLQRQGIFFATAIVAAINNSYILINLLMVVISILLTDYLQSIAVIASETNTTRQSLQQFSILLYLLGAIMWASFVYIQEYEKKIYFFNGYRKVRNFMKLKQIINILVPELVRERFRSGKKNFSDNEGEVTIVFIDIHQFDAIVNSYSGNELVSLLDTAYNAFDQICD